MGAFGEGRLSWQDREPAIAAILRAIGLDARQAKSVLARLPFPPEGALPTVPRKSSRPRQQPSS